MVNQRKSWWGKKYGKDSICSITKTRLRAGRNKDGVRNCIFLNCKHGKHGFYRSVIISWILAGNNTCPMCRSPIDIRKIFI